MAFKNGRLRSHSDDWKQLILDWKQQSGHGHISARADSKEHWRYNHQRRKVLFVTFICRSNLDIFQKELAVKSTGDRITRDMRYYFVTFICRRKWMGAFQVFILHGNIPFEPPSWNHYPLREIASFHVFQEWIYSQQNAYHLKHKPHFHSE